MKRKIKFLLVSMLLVALALPLASCKKEEEQPDTRPLVTITLDSGETIKLRLYPEAAPITVENFIKYAEAGFYDGTIFHRIIKDFMIQAGGYYVSGDERLVYKEPLYEAIKGEFSDNHIDNPLEHAAGVISMARTGAVDSATSQFFICTDMPEEQATFLDGKYAAFGKVADTASLNVVRRLAKVNTAKYSDETLGTFENLPLETVKIATVTVKR